MFKRFILVFLIPLFFFSCSKKNENQLKKPSILVSIAPYAYFAEKIAGHTIDVQVLIPPGMNLHIYEPSPKAVEANAKASAWFRIDEPIERKIIAAFKERSPQMKLVNLQEGLNLSGDDAVELSPCTGHHHDRDLHTWLSPKLARKQAQLIASTLIELFPENKRLYEKNYNNLALELSKLQRDLAIKLEPFKGQALLVSHPAFGYFCKDYDLLQLSVECEGKDPRPRDVEEILKKAKAYQVRCVILQQGFNNRGAQIIGQKLQLPNFRFDPYAKCYLENMQKLAGYIAK